MELLNFLFVSIISIFILIYWFFTKNYSYWKNQNVPFIPNPIPLFGHMLPIVTIRDSITAFVGKVYKNSSASMMGFYFMRKPGLIVCDPELVKCVLQTNFSSFRANLITLDEKQDPVWSKHPFFTLDMDLWKERRIQITNNLSGKKLKDLLIIIQEVCNQMNDFVQKKIEANNNSYECELKKLFTRCTSEIVANAAFGIEGQSFEDNPAKLSFAKESETVFQPTLLNGIKQAIIFFLPELAETLGIRFMADHTDKYFRENILAIIKERRNQTNVPSDFMQFVLDSKVGENLDSVIVDIMIFYGDVYETSSGVLAHLFYHLSINTEIQIKLREHLISKLDNKPITYEILKELNYLDQVINESMRVTPPLGVQMKKCTEEITLTGSDGLKCHLKPGNVIFIPTMNLHLDEKYWSDPEKFDPDRFSPENQAENKKFTFLPFGEGPRMCVGMRLGMMIVKTIATHFLLNYSVEHSSKTKVPLEIEPTSAVTLYKGGVWAKVKKWNYVN